MKTSEDGATKSVRNYWTTRDSFPLRKSLKAKYKFVLMSCEMSNITQTFIAPKMLTMKM